MKAVIMAGGQGTRFWPASRRDRPKQFLKLGSRQKSLIQMTFDRLEPAIETSHIYVVCSAAYAQIVQQQLPMLKENQIVIEPAARNTAPCIGLAAERVVEDSGTAEETMLVLPSDHLIRDEEAFYAALTRAEELAQKDLLVTFGIQPTFPSTGYGYLEKGDRLEEGSAFRVRQFVEKPDRRLAEKYLESGDYLWNSGMFVWKAGVILDQIQRFLPELNRALAEMRKSGWDSEQAAAAFNRAEAVSIDFGVMERAETVVVVPCQLGWSDVGSWRSMLDSDLLSKTNFQSLEIDAGQCVVQAPDGKLVVLAGVQDLVVVDTGDVLFVCRLGEEEKVREVVKRLGEEGLDEFL